MSLNRDRDRLRKYWADMCLIIFEEKAEKQDQYPLSLNRDRDRLQKYWSILRILLYSSITPIIYRNISENNDIALENVLGEETDSSVAYQNIKALEEDITEHEVNHLDIGNKKYAFIRGYKLVSNVFDVKKYVTKSLSSRTILILSML